MKSGDKCSKYRDMTLRTEVGTSRGQMKSRSLRVTKYELSRLGFFCCIHKLRTLGTGERSQMYKKSSP